MLTTNDASESLISWKSKDRKWRQILKSFWWICFLWGFLFCFVFQVFSVWGFVYLFGSFGGGWVLEFFVWGFFCWFWFFVVFLAGGWGVCAGLGVFFKSLVLFLKDLKVYCILLRMAWTNKGIFCNSKRLCRGGISVQSLSAYRGFLPFYYIPLSGAIPFVLRMQYWVILKEFFPLASLLCLVHQDGVLCSVLGHWCNQTDSACIISEVLPMDTLPSPWDFVSFDHDFNEQFSSLLQDPAFTAKTTFMKTPMGDLNAGSRFFCTTTASKSRRSTQMLLCPWDS